MRIALIAILLLFCEGGVFAESQVPPTNEKPQIEQKTTEKPKNTAKKPTQDAVTGVRVAETEVGALAHYCQVCTQNSEKSKGLISKLNDPTAIFTGLLFLATVALWWATWRLVTGAEKTAERQLRAYVFVTESSITDTDRPDIKRIAISIKNTGQTPAFNVIHWQNSQIFPYPGNPVFPGKQNIPLSTSMLGPGMETDKLLDVKISPSEGSDILAGTKALYIWGGIEYVDAFKITRHTGYCFVRGGHFDICGEALTYCEYGNEAI